MRKSKPISRPTAIVAALLVLLAAALCSCGYSNPYARLEDPEGGPAQPVSIYVDMWKNNTSELGLQSEMTQALVRWLKKSRHFTMAPGPDQADYTLRGTIESAHYPGLSYGTFDRAVELRAELTFSFEVKNNRTGEIILQREESPWHENYAIGRDAAITEVNKRRVLTQIIDKIGENIYINLYHAFSTGRSDIPVEQIREPD
jgi:hypothetical protein